ncbi:hypothetical protein IW139_000312 [Coemansia sp. RSA 353]|nr:hypothetical protein LPJ62_004248 [Coemansia sp. RSA 2167]KAJ2139727.1 hypothetical protein GGH17_000303 [Coemansia sp. RSA 788]KAJ2150757.1 hypothetical protein J3F82_003781 [Coemansia sp. RSA 637]KAJ2168869.1 hypothetical protein GGH15_001003 [Coemansia sp. RSA 562]KAJ2176364.1 hypothetical protein GGH16_000088 [Coemansia sp. RSA 560]KAJ2191337.1 hypothetical protein EV181_000356 [Coemansia sp. RSA 532]KAJ2199834.1 hypothetical protein GGH18_000274 [Coemansia sp. RSA 530]KAJ2201096.1 hy
MQLKCGALVSWAGVLFFASTVQSAPVSATPNLIVFGNSLSDTGNLVDAVGGSGFFGGRATNSYVWNEYTAKILGMQLVNRAYRGATSNNDLSPATWGNFSVPSFHDQVAMWLKETPNPSQFNLDNDVIEIEIGGNDILHHMDGLATGAIELAELATKIADTIATDMQLLATAGYKNIILWNLPAVDKTPFVLELNAGALIKPVIETINAATSAYVKTVADNNAAKTNGIHVFDLNWLTNLGLQPEVSKHLGITNPTDACYVEDADGKASVCTDPDTHFFYDGVHPAGRMHYLWGIVAAVWTRDPNATIDVNEIIRLAGAYDIDNSNSENNIIVNGITPSQSESEVIPSTTSDYATDSASNTPIPTKCH